LQLSAVQAMPSSQATGVPGWQIPPPQTSIPLQYWPSLQDRALGACTQPLPELQESVVQMFASSQFGAGPPTHAPLLQASFVVQALPSLHASVLFACWQPPTGRHESVVQAFASSQFRTLPAGKPPDAGLAPSQTSLLSHSPFVVHWVVVAARVASSVKSVLFDVRLCAWIVRTFVPVTSCGMKAEMSIASAALQVLLHVEHSWSTVASWVFEAVSRHVATGDFHAVQVGDEGVIVVHGERQRDHRGRGQDRELPARVDADVGVCMSPRVVPVPPCSRPVAEPARSLQPARVVERDRSPVDGARPIP